MSFIKTFSLPESPFFSSIKFTFNSTLKNSHKNKSKSKKSEARLFLDLLEKFCQILDGVIKEEVELYHKNKKLPPLSLNKCKGELVFHITLCGSRKMRNLNNQFRNKDKVTDVLSFPLLERVEWMALLKNLFDEKHASENDLGDIVICLDKAISDAKYYKITLREELEMLLIHGFLHLIGYDHELSKTISKEDERVMMEKQNYWLKKFNK